MYPVKAAFAASAVMGVSAASATSLVSSFSYENLTSSFDSNTSNLVTMADAGSTGSVSRHSAPAGMADFGAGSADFLLDLNVTNVFGNSADGAGTVTATDLNGDTLTANVIGDFTYMPLVGPLGVIFFDGFLSDVMFNDTSGDGEFNGDTSFFSMNFSGQPYVGAIQRLQVGGVDFFQTDWSSELAEADGQIVPAPGVLTVLGVTVACAGRRRRR